jgi:hypothetical protein
MHSQRLSGFFALSGDKLRKRILLNDEYNDVLTAAFYSPL